MSLTRVSLAPAAAPGQAHPASPHELLLVPSGARVILGAPQRDPGDTQPIAPTASSLFGPRGVCAAGPQGPLFVCDTGHHRLLAWNRLPAEDYAEADLIAGQPNFSLEGRNAKGDIGPATLNVPTGVAFSDGVLAVADAWNHRVLIWHGGLARSNQPADVVLGQADFTSGMANRGADTCRADTLNWCYGVAIAEGHLFVADTGNRRVLIWNRIPETNGQAADAVLGQHNFVTRDENAGSHPDALGMRWPHGIASKGLSLFVSDAGNNRIMVWEGSFEKLDRRPCDFVLGQGDFRSVDNNRGAYYPNAAAMNMPYGVALTRDRLMVADTANSRLLGLNLSGLTEGDSASHLAGQPGFTAKGDNRWGMAQRDSLCWPYGIAICEQSLLIADSGNNRVLTWDLAQ